MANGLHFCWRITVFRAPQGNGVRAHRLAHHSILVVIHTSTDIHPATTAEIPRLLRGVAALFLTIVFIWSYWPTLVLMVQTWESNPDYSHGYLVGPLALFFLWARRESYPGVDSGFAIHGLWLVLAGFLLRTLGGLAYVDAIEAWSMLLWIGGTVWFLCGWDVFKWSFPAVAFLWFMIPLPFSAETFLSFPLQRIAARISCWGLQFLGQPALREGNVILMGDHQLEVAEACSGLRIFMGIVALAFAYLILTRRLWWERVLLLLAVVPIALVANASRIIVTGLLYQFVSRGAGARFSHDFAGFLMIPFATLLFWLFLWYLGKLTYEVAPVDVKTIVLGSRSLTQPE